MLAVLSIAGASGHVVPASTAHSPFAQKALAVVSAHPIVQKNAYTEWFATGDSSIDEARDLVVQFSVFSNLFLLAQVTA